MTICGWLTDANMADAASVVGRMGHALRVDDAQRFAVLEIPPMPAEPTKRSSSHNFPAREAISPVRADVDPTGAPRLRRISRTSLHRRDS